MAVDGKFMAHEASVDQYGSFNSMTDHLAIYVPDNLAATATKSPAGSSSVGGFLINTVISGNANFAAQIYVARGYGSTPAPALYVRVKWSGNWQEWQVK